MQCDKNRPITNCDPQCMTSEIIMHSFSVTSMQITIALSMCAHILYIHTYKYLFKFSALLTVLCINLLAFLHGLSLLDLLQLVVQSKHNSTPTSIVKFTTHTTVQLSWDTHMNWMQQTNQIYQHISLSLVVVVYKCILCLVLLHLRAQTCSYVRDHASYETPEKHRSNVFPDNINHS